MSSPTACTIDVYPAGCRDGYVEYGRYQTKEIRKLQRAKPYQKIKKKVTVHAHVSAEDKAQSVKRHLLRKGIWSRVSVSFSFIPVPESPSAFAFEEIRVQEELHREPIVLVERCIHKGRSMILKRYMRDTMSWHDSLLEQQLYEMNMYYQDLKGLPNVVQLEGHFQDPYGNLTFVFPDLGVNIYPRHKAGIVSYMRQLLHGLNALCQNDIVHCNIKGGEKPNAIFDSAGRLTIIDFESAVRRHERIGHREAKGETLEYTGNLCYTAPEVLVAQHGRGRYGPTRFGCSRDVYNAGVVFVELLLDIQNLFQYTQWEESGTREDEEFIRVRETLKRRLAHLSPVAALQCYGDFRVADLEFNQLGCDLASKMLTWHRLDRPSPEELLEHPFFSHQRFTVRCTMM